MELALRGSTISLTLNEHGVIYGGDVIGMLDIGAGYYANTKIGKCLTKAVDNMIFHAPLAEHTMYDVNCETVHTGRTSLKVRAVMEQVNKRTGRKVLTAEGIFTFVKVDNSLKPVPLTHT